METVVVLKLADLDRAREAMRGLQRLHHRDALRLEAVAVVKGKGDGRVTVVEEQDGRTSGGTAAGATIGAVLGMLTAPAGVVAAGAAGAIVGSVLDVTDVDESEFVAASISRSVAPSNTAVVAVLVERSLAALDRLAMTSGAELVRRPRAEVDPELAAAQAAVLAPDRRALGRDAAKRR